MYEKKIELRSRVEIILNYEFFDVQRKRKMFYKKSQFFLGHLEKLVLMKVKKISPYPFYLDKNKFVSLEDCERKIKFDFCLHTR